MTDLQRTEDDADFASDPFDQPVDQVDPGLLILPPTPGRTVYKVRIKLLGDAGGLTPAFSLPTSRIWYTGGIQWNFDTRDTEYGLFIDFALKQGIKDLEVQPGSPEFWFSSAWYESQQACMPIQDCTYHFLVNPKMGVLRAGIDPIIIITPLPGDNGGV